MTLLSTIPRRPGFIAHQSGERLAEGAELELAAGAEALPCLQTKYTEGRGRVEGAELEQATGVEAPSCLQTKYTRERGERTCRGRHELVGRSKNKIITQS